MARIVITPCRKVADYVESVRVAGGDPVVLELTAAAASEQLAGADGLLLTGGGDVDPVYYHEAKHETFSAAEPGRDEAELSLAREAMARQLPLLAICRGAQVLNVAAGGTLVQDIPSAVESELSHSVKEPKDLACHAISIVAGTKLADVLGGQMDAACSCRVNSRHHQAVGRTGDGLVVSARAGDGVVEAIEQPDALFCIGVQWHPENFWRSGEFTPLFEALVRAARERMEG